MFAFALLLSTEIFYDYRLPFCYRVMSIYSEELDNTDDYLRSNSFAEFCREKTLF